MKKKIYKKDYNKDFIKRFSNRYAFCSADNKKFILLLRKWVYPYEFMDNWEQFDVKSIPDKKELYSSLNMENIKYKKHKKNLIIKI